MATSRLAAMRAGAGQIAVPAPRPFTQRRMTYCRANPEVAPAGPSQQSAASTGNVDAMAALQALASSTGGAAASSPVEESLAQVTTQLMMADPETAEQLRRYQEAVARVEAAKAAAAQLEEEYAKAGKELALSRAAEEAEVRRKADELMAAAEVAAAEKLLAAAQLQASQAEDAKRQLAQQATQDKERLESVKVGVVAAAGGAASVLPILLFGLTETAGAAADVAGSGGGGSVTVSALLSLAAALGSCFLFGVTYRYAVRGDADNSHLRSGVVGAFGLVRAAAAGDVLGASAPPPADGVSSLAPLLDVATVIGPAALYTGQSMLMFAFASVAVEAGFRFGLVARFPSSATAEQGALDTAAPPTQ